MLLWLLSVALFAVSVVSQTITTTDDAGETVIEVITIDPNLGLPSTTILETIASSSSSAIVTPVVPTTSSTPSLQIATTTAPDVQQGPVGAPAPTSATLGPTIYTYTTTDDTGATIGVIDTFTPVYPSTSTFTPVSTGTILQYSQWLSEIGASTAPTAVTDVQNASQRLTVGASWVGVAAAVISGLVGGAWIVLL